MSGFAMAGSERTLFLFVVILIVPAWVADDVDELAVLVVMRVVRGRVDGVACVKWVGLAPESRMYVMPWVFSWYLVACKAFSSSSCWGSSVASSCALAARRVRGGGGVGLGCGGAGH